MNTSDPQTPIPTGGAFPIPGSAPSEDAEQQASAAGIGASDDRPKVSRGFIALLGLGLFGTYVAFVTPIAISLAIQVSVLAPNNQEYLGILLGVGSLAGLLVGPLGGQLSDRTRSRFGRRKPWLIGGIVVGLIGLTVMASATSIMLLGVGWAIAQIGLSQTTNIFSTIQADKLPESQRGKVGAITGFATMVAPVFGAILGGMVSTQPFLLFLLPGAVALVFVLIFFFAYRDADSRQLTFDDPLSVGTVLRKYVYNPRKYPDFSWNWLGRFLFFFGLTLNTSFTAFFFAQKLGIAVVDIGGTVATVGGIGILGTIGGVFFGGFLSDRLRRRKAFVLGSGILFGIGAIVMVAGTDFTVLLIGSFLCNIAIGVFSAVDQALFLDVLPERETEAGRFINITQFATSIPQALAPLVASAILAIGAVGATRDYSVLYITAAICTIVGGIVVLKVKSVR